MALEADVRAAVRRSHFRTLPEALQARVTDCALRISAPAGADLIEAGSVPRVHLMVAGLAKTFLTAPSGRQVTVRYIRPGDIVAAPSVCDERPSPAGARTLTPSTLLVFDMTRLRGLVRTEVQVANVLNVEMAERVQAYFAELAGTAFGSLRERVIRHLLDAASEQQRGATLVARLSQQELADAVGSVREVVARVLGKLREEGLVCSQDGGIELVDADRLAEEAVPAVTRVTRAGDSGR